MTKPMARRIDMENAKRLYRRAMRLFVNAGPESYDELFSLMSQAAEAGSVEATAALGTFYDYGMGARRSASRAVKLYRAAAVSGNPDAQYNLGLALFEGHGVKRDQ